MRRNTAVALAAFVLAAAGAPAARAQSPHIGSYAAYDFDGRNAGVGGQVLVPLQGALDLYPSATYYFVDTGSMWALNADLRYRLPSIVYLGGGVHVRRSSVGISNATNTGANVLGGVESRRGRVHPFVEGRVLFDNGSAFQLNGGVNMTIR